MPSLSVLPPFAALALAALAAAGAAPRAQAPRAPRVSEAEAEKPVDPPKVASAWSPSPRARAKAKATVPETPPAETFAPDTISFPLDGPARILDTFGEARGGKRTHEGVDMMSPRRTPVLAAADGVVSWAHDQIGGRCCDLELRHEGGWRTRYIHLDNDTPGTDDGLGFGIADGVVEGARVSRGQVIGWVGDSGNAEACDPHLHFELRGPDGKPVDPRPILLQLQALPAGAEPGCES